ncbi:MAG TPA: peptide chain release factor-like protein [Tepidisphaeraceae bacterium]
MSESALLADCRFEFFRGPGPGGQKRNKTSNSVRLTHLPTGIHVTAGESRSLEENKRWAVRRLKRRLATDVRHAIDPRSFEPPAWFSQVVQLGRLAVSHRNEHYARTAALVLDLLDSRRGTIGDVARLLDVTTSSVVKFLAAEPPFWSAANAIRKSAGQPPLEKR